MPLYRLLNNSKNFNIVINALNQAIGIGFPILIQYYLIRHFKIEDLGYLNLLNSYWAILLMIPSFLDYHLIKVLAEADNEEVIKSILTNTLVLMYGLLFIPTIIMLSYLCIYFQNIQKFVLITSIPLFTVPLAFELYFQVFLKNTYIFFRRLIIRLLLLAIIFFFAKEESDFIIYLYAFSLTTAIESIINFFFIRKLFSFSLVNKEKMKDIIKHAIKYLPFKISYNILPNLSIILTTSFIDIKLLAVYAILVKIINLATTFITSTVMILYPQKIIATKNKDNSSFSDKSYLVYTTVVSLFVIGLLISTHKIVFDFFLHGNMIPDILLNFTILSFFILFHSIYNYVAFNYFFHKGQILFITTMNFLIVAIYLFELFMVKLGYFNFNFAIMFILPFPIVCLLIFFKIKNANLDNFNSVIIET